jgi:hypothetical protein
MKNTSMLAKALLEKTRLARLISTEPHFSDDLIDQINDYNGRVENLLGELAQHNAAADILTAEIIGGSCTRPATAIVEMAKLKGKALKTAVELLNHIGGKHTLDAPIKAAFKVERERNHAAMEKRVAKLEKDLHYQDPRARHFSILSDPERRGYDDAASRCQSAINAGSVATKEDATLIESLKQIITENI